ncbi:MAG TPA: hypothetical protein VHM64_12285, partial [Candidatus Binatia bacterium]|nr:hypothetical protein [Candidatus Binatia bacterium]
MAIFATFADFGWAAGPRVQILSPQNGARISHDQSMILLTGKVASHRGRSPNVDIFFLIDVSLSTAHYAGVDFPDLADLPPLYISPGAERSRPQISLSSAGPGGPPAYNLRNSIFAAEIIASRRMLSQLDAKTTRVGIIA